jgi:hypothetical protein
LKSSTRQRAALLILAPGLLVGCSSPSSSVEAPVDVVVSFINSYDQWARDGYADPIPDSLRVASSKDMFGVIEDDQNWYSEGGVQQHGSVRIVETRLSESSDNHAVVDVVIDATAVSVTAGGEETFVDYSQPIRTSFNLEKDAFWRITSTDSVD